GNVFAFALIAVSGPMEPASARAARQGVQLPPGFDAWFLRAAAPNPADRFPTATMAVSALAEVFRMAPLSAGISAASGMSPPVGVGAQRAASSPFITGTGVTGAPVERRKGSLVAALSVGLVVLGGVIFFAVRLLGT